MENPNDYATNEIAVHESVPTETHETGGTLSILSELTSELEGKDLSDTEYGLRILETIAADAVATRKATEQLVALFSEAVTTINVLAEKADGLFSGDGPALGGPAGMILGALIPRKRG